MQLCSKQSKKKKEKKKGQIKKQKKQISDHCLVKKCAWCGMKFSDTSS